MIELIHKIIFIITGWKHKIVHINKDGFGREKLKAQL